MKKSFYLPFLLLTLPACLGVLLPHVSPTQAEWATQKWPEMDQNKLAEARHLYVNKCSGCHMVILPSHLPLPEWEIMVSSMAVKAKISDAEKEMIWRYIQTAKSQ